MTASLYRVPSIGGTAEELIADVDERLSVHLARRAAASLRTVGSSERSSLVVANVDGTGERVVATLQDSEWFEEDGPGVVARRKNNRSRRRARTRGGDSDEFRLVGFDLKAGQLKNSARRAGRMLAA